MAEHASKLDQIRALREARIRAAERAALVSDRAALATDIVKKPNAKSAAVTDPVQGK